MLLWFSSLEIAPDGTSFVTHSLSASKRHMEGLLQEFERGEKGSWPWNILRSIDKDYIGFGFSEYASYVSWMIQNHPEELVRSPGLPSAPSHFFSLLSLSLFTL